MVNKNSLEGAFVQTDNRAIRLVDCSAVGL